MALATEPFGASFFGNGAWPGLIAQHPGKLSSEAHTRLKESLNNALQGPSRAHGLIVTEEGIKIEKAGIPPNDSQFLETRAYQVNDTARLFGVPPTVIGGALEGVLDVPKHPRRSAKVRGSDACAWGRNLEGELNRKLLAPYERDTHYFEISFEGLLRGDETTRYTNTARRSKPDS